MTPNAWERPNTRLAGQGQTGSTWVAVDCPTFDVAAALVGAYTPLMDGSLFREPLTGKEVAPGTWEFEVKYGPKGWPEPQTPTPTSGWEFAFDSSVESEHITQSYETVASYKSGAGEAPDLGKAIGCAIGQEPTGVDVLSPIYSWTERYKLLRTWADTETYRGIVQHCVGRTNAAGFRGFEIGEVLMTGASGGISAENPEIADVTFRFSQRRNRSNVTIGDITGIAKKGWEYLWVLYSHKDVDGYLLPEAQFVYIERVYNEADYSSLFTGIAEE